MRSRFLLIAFALLFNSTFSFSQTPVLGTAASKFALFTTTGALTNTNIPRSQITGDVGTNSASAVTGFVNVNGVIQTPANATTAQAELDLDNVVGQINAAAPSTTISGALGAPNAGQTLTPGVYDIAGASMLDGNLNLDGLNNPNAVFIFRISGNLASAFAAKVKLINQTQACNVFWRVIGTINLASETYMAGNMIAVGGAIDLTVKDTLQGRAFTIVGAITTNGVMAFVPTGCGEPLPAGPAKPVVGTTASCYAIFTKVGNVTDANGSVVTGDIGTNSGTVGAYDPLKVDGMIHPGPDLSTAAAASDLTTLYNNLDLLSPDIILNAPAQFGNGLVLTPHTYLLAAETSLTDTVYLNAQGVPDAVFVIQVNGALNVAAQSYVKLINGAEAKNVFWLVRNSAATWGVNAVFNGSVIAGGAISTVTSDSISGRLFTIAGAITTDASVITADITECAGVLPVSWLYFKGIPAKATVELEWSTAAEINNKFFTIEKSPDGISFQTLGTVYANALAGTADRKYNFTDQQPYSLNFYRLSQTNENGSRSYYHTIQVKMNALPGVQVNSYTNGSNIHVQTSGATAGKGFITLYSIEGKKILTQHVVLTKEPATYKLLKPSQKGVYVINITSESGTIYNGKINIQ